VPAGQQCPLELRQREQTKTLPAPWQRRHSVEGIGVSFRETRCSSSTTVFIR